jgi:hypothetical protein
MKSFFAASLRWIFPLLSRFATVDLAGTFSLVDALEVLVLFDDGEDFDEAPLLLEAVFAEDEGPAQDARHATDSTTSAIRLAVAKTPMEIMAGL